MQHFFNFICALVLLDYGRYRSNQFIPQNIQWFAPFNDEEWDMVVPHLMEKQLKKNRLFAQEGKKSREIAFVLTGNLRQYDMKDGEEKTTYFYFENYLMISYISCKHTRPG